MKPDTPKEHIMTLGVLTIRTDGGTQGRLSIDSSVVAEYAELMSAGVTFPAVRVWFDGTEYWLVDGFHRLAASKAIGASEIRAEVALGSLEDAKWASYSANSTHGVRRTRADIDAIIRRVLQHPRSLQLSNNQIARHINVPEATFRRWRKRLSSANDEDRRRIAIRAGKSYVIDTGAIGGRHEVAIGDSRPVKGHKTLLKAIAQARNESSPDVRRVLNVLEKWLRNDLDTSALLGALERLVQSFLNTRHEGRRTNGSVGSGSVIEYQRMDS